ncbi:unnamed protein product, partial [Rotaria sp. Silwood1]
NMRGLGFEGGILEQLQQQQDELTNQREVGIPGLEFSNEDEESRRRRAPFAKPVPKSFEEAWRSVDTFSGKKNNSNNHTTRMIPSK